MFQLERLTRDNKLTSLSSSWTGAAGCAVSWGVVTSSIVTLESITMTASRSYVDTTCRHRTNLD